MLSDLPVRKQPLPHTGMTLQLSWTTMPSPPWWMEAPWTPFTSLKSPCPHCGLVGPPPPFLLVNSGRLRVSHGIILLCEKLALKAHTNMCFISLNCSDGGGLIKMFFPVTHPGWGWGPVYHKQTNKQKGPSKEDVFLPSQTHEGKGRAKNNYFRRFSLWIVLQKRKILFL